MITKIMKIIARENVICAQFIAIKLGVPTSKARDLIKILKDQGLLSRFHYENNRSKSFNCGSCLKSEICSIKYQLKSSFDHESLIMKLK